MAHYLTFASKEAFTIGTYNATKNWDGTLYYSTDTVTWSEWSGTTTLQSAEHAGEHRLYMRGSGNTTINNLTESRSNGKWVLTGSEIRCIGNIEYLLDYATVMNGEHPVMAAYCYYYLFHGATSLVKAPEMPSPTVTSSCYYAMYSGTSVTEPVKLPALKLTGVSMCYGFMFNNTRIQLSKERTDYYTAEYRIPPSGEATGSTTSFLGPTQSMFSGTAGTFVGKPSLNTTYYYHPDSVIITFLDWDGTVISQKEYEPGAPIEVPPNPTRPSENGTNYAFRGWSTSVSTTAASDCTYTAVYEATTLPVYTIRFLDWDDSVIDAPQFIEGEIITLPANPTRPDDDDYRYTFVRWEPNVPATATANGDYKAVYSAAPCYRIEFLDWDGSVISSERYLQDAIIAVPANPVRESDGAYNYEFDKWTPDVYSVAVAHATYTATYKATLIPVFYDIVFQDWDGTVISSTNYAAGDKVVVPPDPVKESDGVYTFAFKGWNPAVSSIARANVTYVAEYTATEIPVYYDIVFLDWDGSTISKTATLKNTDIVIPPDPNREDQYGYWFQFTGWSPTVPAKATASGTYTATYVQYKIYRSIDEILENTSEFTTVLNNTKTDSGPVTVSGVSWFTYNGTKCTSIYVHGDSYFGLGSSAAHLSVNNRDGAVWNIYREEGMLYRYYKFLRIRFSGYSYYSYSTDAYKITYDVILWDTGDISLHMVDVPTSYYTGTFKLGDTSYTKPTATYPNVVFKLQSDGTYTASRTLIDLKLPFTKKFLVKIYDDADYKLYTVVDGALSELSTKAVTKATFAEFGCDELPSGDLLVAYKNFELLRWYDSEEYTPEVQVTAVAHPYPQTVESKDYNMTHGTIFGIEKVLVEATETVSFAISTDSGVTWKAFKEGVWVELSENESGMSADTIRLITTEQWNSVVTGGKYRFRMTLADEESVFNSLIVDYLNEAE